ncbi:MAG: 1-phosphofructokinase family hexose kinase [Acidobacteriota bacterium]
MAKILVTGLNPAWQKVLEFEELKAGHVNRALSSTELGSGKGLNVGLVLGRLGHEVSLVQVLGGINGARLKAYCRERRIESVDIDVRCETRVCSTLIDWATGQVTELIEPFSVVAEERVKERLLNALKAGSGWDALIMSGSAPAGLEPGVYLEIARQAQAPLVVLDVVRELTSELLTQAHVLKINAHEQQELKRRGVTHPLILVTDGPRTARLFDRRTGSMQETWYRLPALSGVRNPIGAGDTVTAWLTHELLRGKPVTDAFRQALAAGSASCLTLLPGEYDEGKRQEIAAQIEVRVRRPG